MTSFKDNEKLWAVEDTKITATITLTYGDLRCLEFFFRDPEEWAKTIRNDVYHLVKQIKKNAKDQIDAIEAGLDREEDE